MSRANAAARPSGTDDSEEDCRAIANPLPEAPDRDRQRCVHHVPRVTRGGPCRSGAGRPPRGRAPRPPPVRIAHPVGRDPRPGARGRMDRASSTSRSIAPSRDGRRVDAGEAARRDDGSLEVAARRQAHPIALADERNELTPRALGLDPTFVDDPDPVAQPLGLLHVVGRVQDRPCPPRRAPGRSRGSRCGSADRRRPSARRGSAASADGAGRWRCSVAASCRR